MKNKTASILIVCGAFAAMLILVLALCAKVLSASETVFAFNDGNIETALSPQYKAPEVLFRCWSNQTFFGNHAVAVPISLNTLFETLLGPAGFRRIGVVMAVFLTALAAYWTMRQFDRSIHASLLTALFFLLCGWNFTFPTVGLPIRSFAMFWSLLSLGTLEKARRTGRWLLYIIAGGLLGMGISETADVGGIFAIACGGFMFLTHIPLRQNISGKAVGTGIAKLIVYAIISALMSYQIVTALIVSGVASTPQENTQSPEQRFAWATQWSLPKVETWSLIACGHHGVSSRSQDAPYWGGIGRSEGWEQTRQGFRNFSLAGYAVGTVPFIFLSFLIAWLVTCRDEGPERDKRKIIFSALAIALVSLMLSWGRHFPLYRLFYSLPHMASIRNPDKWLGPFTLFLGIAFAYAVDIVIEARTYPEDKLKKARAFFAPLASLIPVTAIIMLVYLYGAKGYFISSLENEGYSKQAVNAWQYAVKSNLVALTVSILCSGAIWFYTGKRNAGNRLMIGLTLGISLLAALELGRANLPYVIGYSYSHLKKPNALTEFLDTHRYNGRIKLMPAQHPLINNWRMTYLLAGGYDVFDPVSIRNMPPGLQPFLNAFQANPLKLWQIGSLRYFLCDPKQAEQLLSIKSGETSLFQRRLGLGVWRDQGSFIPIPASQAGQKYIDLLEFTAALPIFRFVPNWTAVPDSKEGDKLVLDMMARADFNPAQAVFLQGDNLQSGSGGIGNIQVVKNISTEAVIKTQSQEGGLVARSVRHDNDWKVYIDGNPAELYRADYLFQAVTVPPGQHEVTFSFEPSIRPLIITAISRLILFVLVIAAVLPFPHRKVATQ